MRSTWWGVLAIVAAGCAAEDGDGKGASADPDTDAGAIDSAPPAETDVPPVDSATDSAPPIDTMVADPCGNDVIDAGESCDDGAANGPDANCLDDCTWNATTSFVVSQADAQAVATFDGRGVADALAPAGTGAWGTSPTDLNGDSLVKFELYYDPKTPDYAVLGDITVADLDELSFWTKKPGAATSADFYLVIYTEPDGVDDRGAFYGYRLTATPWRARGLVAPPDTWNRWSTKTPTNQLTFIDEPVTGTFSATGTPTLAELQATTTFDWQSVDGGFPATTIDYGKERIKFLSIQTGSGTQTSAFEGLLDLLFIRLKDGRTVTVDLEP